MLAKLPILLYYNIKKNQIGCKEKWYRKEEKFQFSERETLAQL